MAFATEYRDEPRVRGEAKKELPKAVRVENGRCQALSQAEVTLEDLERVRGNFKDKSFMGKQQF